MVAYYKLVHGEPEYRAQMLARADGKWIKRADYEADLAAARAEIERLTKELEHMTAVKDIHQRKRHEHFERAEKAEAERDEARAQLVAGFEMAAQYVETVPLEVTCRQEHTRNIRAMTPDDAQAALQSLLADAERDMRQRAADVCDCACMDGIGDEIRAIGDAILALPLKHADREGRV